MQVRRLVLVLCLSAVVSLTQTLVGVSQAGTLLSSTAPTAAAQPVSAAGFFAAAAICYRQPTLVNTPLSALTRLHTFHATGLRPAYHILHHWANATNRPAVQFVLATSRYLSVVRPLTPRRANLAVLLRPPNLLSA